MGNEATKKRRRIRAKSKAEGKIEGKIEIAKNMIISGFEIEIISKITGLTVDDIERLR